MFSFLNSFVAAVNPAQYYLLAAQSFFLLIAVITIQLQNRGAGLSSSFGGSNEIYLTRRGIEKSIVWVSVFCVVAFVLLRIVALYIKLEV